MWTYLVVGMMIWQQLDPGSEATCKPDKLASSQVVE